MIRKVLICDDRADRVIRWSETVHSFLPDAQVDVLTGSELADLVLALADREDAIRGGPHPSVDHPGIVLAEAADVILIDSDLSPQPHDLKRLDEAQRKGVAAALRGGFGDSVARQLRSYTRCKTLVVINMFWGRHAQKLVFDLTLAQEVGTFADLHITAGELSEPSLWGVSAGRDTAFRPWGRPSIPELVATHIRSLDAVIELDGHVLDSLNIDALSLSAKHLDFFAKAAEELTYRDLAFSSLGFKYAADHEESRVDGMARSVARRWLQNVVVPSQTVLVEIPHAIERYWGLIVEAESDIDALVTSSWDSDLGRIEVALKRSVEPFVCRPVCDGEMLRKFAAEVSTASPDRMRTDATPLGFAEDVSQFLPIDEVVPFPSDVAGDARRRWVAELEGVGYEPANRLLL